LSRIAAASAPSVARADLCRPVQPLGIGLPYFSSLSKEIYRQGLLDFVEITPEGLARQRREGYRQAIELVPDQLKRAREACADLPIVVHGVELSIGSAHGWNEAYIQMLDAFQSSWPFQWHSEHLGFQTFAGTDGTTFEVGVPLPLPGVFKDEGSDGAQPRRRHRCEGRGRWAPFTGSGAAGEDLRV
jgi:hypothetical protein